VFVYRGSGLGLGTTAVRTIEGNQAGAEFGATVATALLFPFEKHWLVAAFYIWTGSQLMMLIPQFWILALDLWDSRQARTIFPFLTGCGLAGGLAAGAFANQATARLGIEGLLWSMALLLVLVSCTLAHRRRSGPPPAGSQRFRVPGAHAQEVCPPALPHLESRARRHDLDARRLSVQVPGREDFP
jgi:hypothetical protein